MPRIGLIGSIALVATAHAGTLPRSSVERPVELLLTFDDGPDLAYSARIAELVEDFGGRAVFFVNGRRFEGGTPETDARRALVKVLGERGHLIGNHTYDH